MSKKTSTAALDSFRKGQLRNQRRAPRHPAGEERSKEVRKQRGNERTREFGQAQIVVRREDVMNKNAVSGTAGTFRVILPVILRITFCLAMWTLGAMTIEIARFQCAACVLRICNARWIPVMKRGAGFAAKRLRAIRSIEECANEFHQTDKT
jgi:hypothetical protein